MCLLPGAEVSEAGLAFGLLGRCTAGGRPTFFISSWTFSTREEYDIIISWHVTFRVNAFACKPLYSWMMLFVPLSDSIVPFSFLLSYFRLESKSSTFLLISLGLDKVAEKFAWGRFSYNQTQTSTWKIQNFRAELNLTTPALEFHQKSHSCH